MACFAANLPQADAQAAQWGSPGTGDRQAQGHGQERILPSFKVEFSLAARTVALCKSAALAAKERRGDITSSLFLKLSTVNEAETAVSIKQCMELGKRHYDAGGICGPFFCRTRRAVLQHLRWRG